MGVTPGGQLGAYALRELIGAGGMGEVYLGYDARLNRSVALKILPETFAHDADRLARFKREAQILGSLNHPNIGAIYGLEECGGVQALVLELVEGPTLADCIAVGPLPLEQALRYARQITEALEAAHERGVVHRDLKPANIKVTPDDNIKVLDFGLAKAAEAAASAPALTQSPTISFAATQAGIILGTAPYMSPEQAKGLAVDHRSDVFSFGCVLYEMLTGRQPFEGDTVADVLGAVLITQPDFTRLPAHHDSRLTELIRRCLEKRPKQRWQSVGDLRYELDAIMAAPLESCAARGKAAGARQPAWRRALALGGALIFGALIAGGVLWILQPSVRASQVQRFQLSLPDGAEFRTPGRQTIAISPDGTVMAYIGNSNQLFVRSMSQFEPRLLPTDGGPIVNPVFSPDGASIAFWSAQTLKRIAVSGGVATAICRLETSPFGISWGPNGLVVGQGLNGIVRVSGAGGAPELLVRVEADEVAHGPQMLPDGETLLFTLAKGRTGVERWDKAQIVTQSLRTNLRKVILEGGSDGRYLPTGHLVYAVSGVLFARRFDPVRLEASGEPVPVLEGIRRSINGSTGIAQFSVSRDGTLIYRPGPLSAAGGQWDLALIDQKGTVESLNLPSSSEFLFPRMAPDGKRIAYTVESAGVTNVWIYDVSRTSAARRLTHEGSNRFPLWSPDSQRLVFQSDREGDLSLFSQRADGGGVAERLTKAEPGTSHVPESWSPDGNHLLFGITKGSISSISILSLRDRKTAPFGDVRSTVPLTPVFSPNGLWVAYGAVEAGVSAIWIQRFPDGSKYQVGRGNHPVWSPDGLHILYNAGPLQHAAVRVITEPAVQFGTPASIPRAWVTFGAAYQREYDIGPDGRFVGVVANTVDATINARQINIVLNWFEELHQRIPTR